MQNDAFLVPGKGCRKLSQNGEQSSKNPNNSYTQPLERLEEDKYKCHLPKTVSISTSYFSLNYAGVARSGVSSKTPYVRVPICAMITTHSLLGIDYSGSFLAMCYDLHQGFGR